MNEDVGIRAFQQISAVRSARWHGDTPWSLSDWMVALIGEVGEAAEVASFVADRTGDGDPLSRAIVKTMATLGDAANTLKKLNRHRDGLTTDRDPDEKWLTDELHHSLQALRCIADRMVEKDCDHVRLRSYYVPDTSAATDLAAEFADVLAYLVLIADAVDIDLLDASVTKFNRVSERMGWSDLQIRSEGINGGEDD